MSEAIKLLLFPAMMAFAASSDLLTMTIPNRVSLVMVGGFFLLALTAGMSMAEVASHVGAAFIVLAIAFGFFARGWIGGGDAKLAAATALWFGFGHLMDYALYGSLFGGALTLLILRFRAMAMPGILVGQEWAERLHQPEGGVPYGIALATAALVVYPNTPWMQAVGM
ncbi:MAG: prepilin peptidase CpaA [Alphaproteobacteria bacterium]|jgi:prepilin peptidase CpaA|nr:prepilin peptidase CpaA [Alphaproteobacteria bacterium]